MNRYTLSQQLENDHAIRAFVKTVKHGIGWFVLISMVAIGIVIVTLCMP